MTQYSGVYTLQTQGQALTSGQWATDPYYKNTTLLLHADNVSGSSQNNTFVDSSSNGFAITRNGNTTQGSFTPYGPDWSNSFTSANSDYQNIGVASNWKFLNDGLSDYTVEFWINLSDTSSRHEVISTNTNSVGGAYGITCGTNLNNAGDVFFQIVNGVDGNNFVATTSGGLLSVGKWSHVAITFNASTKTISIYVNGVLAQSVTSGSYSFGNSNPNYTLQVGRWIGSVSGVGGYMNGFISNLRMVNGTILYTGNFAPSTIPLTAVTNTVLLTCQSNRFIDNSSNGYAITISGSPSVQRFSPFPPQYQYTPAVIGGSAYFDGNVDYLEASNASFATGTGDFTVEMWVYYIGNYGIAGSSTALTSSPPYGIGIDGTTAWVGTGSNSDGISGPLKANAWSYIAFVRSGSSLSYYVNGTRVGTTTTSKSVDTTTFRLGVSYNNYTGFCGNEYISNFRFSNSARYSGTTMTIPTGAFSSDANTLLLCNFTNAGIYDNAMMGVMETVGTAQVSTSVVKYGSGSLKFDGTAGWLAFPTTPQWSFGTGDFTVEMWVNLSSSTTNYVLIGNGGYNSSASNVAGWSIMFNTGGTYFGFNSGGNSYYFISSNASLIAATFPVGQWVHVAMVRQNGLLTCYINGKVLGTPTVATEDCSTSSYTPKIGTDVSTSSGYYMNGYMDEVRITKGVARYTAPFTPQKVAFANQ